METSEHPTHKELRSVRYGRRAGYGGADREGERGAQLMLILRGESGLVLGSVSVSTPSFNSAPTF